MADVLPCDFDISLYASVTCCYCRRHLLAERRDSVGGVGPGEIGAVIEGVHRVVAVFIDNRSDQTVEQRQSIQQRLRRRRRRRRADVGRQLRPRCPSPAVDRRGNEVAAAFHSQR